MKTTQIIAALIVATFALAGCETLQGAGKDLQSAGQALEHAVE
ncbi:MAG TPA: entericidin A/B family lipoprotein [Paracoccaceae bacterium]|nr:entericidin A/B family lipoprotein [Paracoccaceae bacterium]